MQKDEKFPLKTSKRREWATIHQQPPSLPQKELEVCWQDILPNCAQALAEVIESVVGSSHPYRHQKQALDYLLESTAKQVNTGLVINGGTYSGKSLSFSIPGIVKLIGKETDFIVVFYPSKQLLLDQFEHMKEYLVKLEEASGLRLTCKDYSGDTGRTTGSNIALAGEQQTELIDIEQNPPNILLATFDKVWYQLIAGKKTPLMRKIMASQYLVFDEIHAFGGFAAAIIKGFIKVHQKKNPDCQVILSSATIDNVESFRDDFLSRAKIITCPPVRGDLETLGTTVEHAVSILAELWVELVNIAGKFCLVFLDSKEDIELLSTALAQKLATEHQFFDEETIAMIHADLPYYERKKILDEVRKEHNNIIRMLFSSSVLELGVNLPNVQVVVNIGIPITQKDGIVQRMARNRSSPGDRRVNIFMFNLNEQRDAFYYHHQGILSKILETNACNPILYPRQNHTILAGLIILHLRYGFSQFNDLMQFFLVDGDAVCQLARQQYTKLVSQMVLKKEYGKVLFTSQGENLLKEQAMKNNPLIPFSIRAISDSYAIKQKTGLLSSMGEDNEVQIGKISVRDVLRRGLPGNIIIRNRQKYLVTEIDRHDKSIFVNRFVTEEQNLFSQRRNRLLDPTITVGVFSKKVLGTKMLEVSFGQLVIRRRPIAIANFSSKTRFQKKVRVPAEYPFFWQELSPQEVEEFVIKEESEGLVLTLKTDLSNNRNLSTKKVLEYLGKILQVEIEAVLSIPATELELVCNDNQIALYDKGGANGNSAYVFSLFQRVAQQSLEHLVECSCSDGCKDCYGEILGLLPKGLKAILQTLIKDLTGMVGLTDVSIPQEISHSQINDEKSRIIVLSDIHLTNDHCFQEEFFEALSDLSKKVDILLINGDLLDKTSEEGWLVFQQLRAQALKEGFWSKLVFIRSSTIHDGNLEQFSGFLHQDYTQFEIGSERVLFVHGNKVGINSAIVRNVGAERAAIQAKKDLIQHGRSWLPEITKETHLVFGHLHTRFYNERFRVYGLGHWTRKGASFDQQCVMVLSSCFSDTLRLFSYKDLIL